MPFTELEIKRCERDLEAFMARKRPPPHIRSRLDFGFRIEGQSVELDEIRPAWDNPEEITHRPFARITFVRSAGEWRLYWKRASGRWGAYEPAGSVRHLAEALEHVARDEYGCFYG
jgi:hypothetical protein